MTLTSVGVDQVRGIATRLVGPFPPPPAGNAAVSKLAHCQWEVRGITIALGEASAYVASVAVDLRLSYPMPSRCGGGAVVRALHERRGSYQAPAAAASRSDSTRPRRRVRASLSVPVGLHLKPGQRGTKHLLQEYGDRLVCVRYRYDAVGKKRIKTVEVVVGESAWQPRFDPDEIVALRVAFTDVATRKRVKQAGGAWDPDRTVWRLRYDRVVALGLRRRITTPQHPVLDAAASSHRHPDADAGPASV